MLKVGTKIKFLHTPDKGKVTARLGDGLVMVLLDGANMEIPTFEEDVIEDLNATTVSSSQPTEDWKDYILHRKNKESEDRRKHAAPPPPPLMVVKPPKSTNSGFLLYFEPVKNPDGTVQKYKIALQNDTDIDALYECTLSYRGVQKLSKEDSLSSAHIIQITEMVWDDLNELPEFKINVKPTFTDGAGEWMEKTIKIKAQSFFKTATWIGNPPKEVHLYTLWEKLDQTVQSNDDLSSYTKALVKKVVKPIKEADAHWFDPIASVSEYASFVNEIDLHIEELHESPGKLSSQEILQIQMKAFDKFLDKAISLGVPKVFIIHGIGKGKLKDSVHARLRRRLEVVRFHNNYHEKYGWGASEVIISRG